RDDQRGPKLVEALASIIGAAEDIGRRERECGYTDDDFAEEAREAWVRFSSRLHLLFPSDLCPPVLGRQTLSETAKLLRTTERRKDETLPDEISSGERALRKKARA